MKALPLKENLKKYGNVDVPHPKHYFAIYGKMVNAGAVCALRERSNAI